MSKPYEIKFEVEGPAAMFTRPDTGSTPISYPVPTSSAAKGIFDAILRRSHIFVQPTKVEICKPIRYERYVTNYGGPTMMVLITYYVNVTTDAGNRLRSYRACGF